MGYGPDKYGLPLRCTRIKNSKS